MESNRIGMPIGGRIAGGKAADDAAASIPKLLEAVVQKLLT
jgi:hypothetical protein